MRTVNLSFPHPVLGVGNDVSGDYNSDLIVKLSKDSVKLFINHHLENETLSRLIGEGTAVYCTEINCPQTLFRKSFITNETYQSFEIKSSDLRDKVEAHFYIVSTESIKNYKITGSHSDYNGFTFDISKGDVLAFGGDASFIARKSWEALRAVSSFMEIVKSDIPDSPVMYDLSHDKILISVCDADFSRYNELKDYEPFSPVFHSSIVYPALIFALSQMMSDDTEHIEDSLWFKIIEQRKSNDAEINSKWDLSHVPEIAQIILKSPLNRSLNGMKKVLENINKVTEE